MPEADTTKLAGVGKSLRTFWVALAALLLAFAVPLYHWVRFSINDELYGHAVLVPFVSAYLIWTNRPKRAVVFAPSPALAMGLYAIGLLWLAAYWWRVAGGEMGPDEAVALTMLACISCCLGTVAVFLGRDFIWRHLFPLGFLLCAVPLPIFVRGWIEGMLQYGSAATAYGMFNACGTLAEWNQLDIDLSNITLTIAPECSGIHSSLVLLFTGLLASYLFLRSPWRRLALTLFIIPLAVLRNGFRIFTIGELCVHIGPQMINHWIHRKGGPIFFALSLIPFLIFLLILYRSERRPSRVVGKPAGK